MKISLMPGHNPALSSPKFRKLALFAKRAQSAPADEQNAFYNHRHPCQDKGLEGLVAARSWAQALKAGLELCHEVKRDQTGADSAGYVLVGVTVGEAVRKWTPCYCDFKGYHQVERANHTGNKGL